MNSEIKTLGIDGIKLNVSRGISYEDAQYGNFIDIAAHVAIKALVEQYKHNILDNDAVKNEFDVFKKWYEIFSQAYVAERNVLKTAMQNATKAKLELTNLTMAQNENEALKYAIQALRCICDNDLIGQKWVK